MNLLNILASGLSGKEYAVSVTSNTGVRGKAKNWSYHCAAVYGSHLTKDGRLVYKVEEYGPARRGFKILEKDCYELSDKYNAKIFNTHKCGNSLHNTKII